MPDEAMGFVMHGTREVLALAGSGSRGKLCLHSFQRCEVSVFSMRRYSLGLAQLRNALDSGVQILCQLAQSCVAFRRRHLLIRDQLDSLIGRLEKVLEAEPIAVASASIIENGLADSLDKRAGQVRGEIGRSGDGTFDGKYLLLEMYGDAGESQNLSGAMHHEAHRLIGHQSFLPMNFSVS